MRQGRRRDRERVDAERRREVDLLLGPRKQVSRVDALGGRDARLDEVDQCTDLGEGLGELTRVLDERLHLTQTDGARRHPQATDHRDDDVVQVSEEHDGRHDHPGDELGAEARLEQLVVALAEFAFDLGLTAERLDQLVPGVGFLDLTVELAGVLPLVDEVRLRTFGDDRGDGEGGRHGQQCDQCQQRRDPDHHTEDAEHGQHAGDQLAQCLLQAGGDVVDVVGHLAEKLTARVGVEVFQRQSVDLLLDAGTQVADGALQSDVEHVSLRPREQ